MGLIIPEDRSPNKAGILCTRQGTAFDLLVELFPGHAETQATSKAAQKSSGEYYILRGANWYKEELLRVAKQFQLKGLIAKRPDSLYEPG